MPKNKNNIIAILILVIIVILIIYFITDYNRTKTEVTEKTGTRAIMTSPLGEFNPQEPKLTEPLAKIPSGAISIKISRGKFEPQKFTVRSGEAISLVLTALDGTHSLVFKDKSLKKIEVYVGRDESRGISFLAPKAGNYSFYCNIPGHKGAGEEGLMTVR